MNKEGSCDASESNATLIPSIDLDVGSMEYILAEDHTIRACPAEKDDIAGVEAGSKVFGPVIDVFEIVLLPTIPGDSCAELQVYGHTTCSNNHASNPNEQGQADTAGKSEYSTGSSEDASPDHAVEDEEDGREDADLTFGIGLEAI